MTASEGHSFKMPGEVVHDHPRLTKLDDGSKVFNGVIVDEVVRFSGTPTDTVKQIVDSINSGAKLIIPAVYGDQSIIMGIIRSKDESLRSNHY